MSIIINQETINEHIERVNSLLKKQHYVPQATALTTNQRKKLYKFFFTYDKFGQEECKFGDYYDLNTQEEVDALNQKVFENMDKKTCAIVLKCGVNPKKIFVMDGDTWNMESQLVRSMQAYSIAEVGLFTVEVTRNHPIDGESVEIKSLSKDVRQEKFDKYKDGEATFIVSCDMYGKKKQIYFAMENMHFSQFVSFMGIQIGGYFGMSGYNFSGRHGMLEMDEKKFKAINNGLMPFFESFEESLIQCAKDNESNKTDRHSSKNKEFMKTFLPHGNKF